MKAASPKKTKQTKRKSLISKKLVKKHQVPVQKHVLVSHSKADELETREKTNSQKKKRHYHTPPLLVGMQTSTTTLEVKSSGNFWRFLRKL